MPHGYQALQSSSIRTVTRLNFQCRKNSPQNRTSGSRFFYKLMAQEFNYMFKFFIVDASESRVGFPATLLPTFKYFLWRNIREKRARKWKTPCMK
jgi:hypothetical protein